MKKYGVKVVAMILAMTMVLLLLLPLSASAATSDLMIQVVADKTSVVPGDTVNVTVRLNGTDHISDDDKIGAIFIVLSYDPTKFNCPTMGSDENDIPSTVVKGSENTFNTDEKYVAPFPYSSGTGTPGKVLYSVYQLSPGWNKTAGGADNSIDLVTLTFIARSDASSCNSEFLIDNSAYITTLGYNDYYFNSTEITPCAVNVISNNVSTYTVSYDSQGGSNVNSQKVTENNKTAAPKNPVKTGYTFAGWYKEAECKSAWNFSSDKVTSNITLYAKWKTASYTVTFKNWNGTVIDTQSIMYGNAAVYPKDPVREGYTFNGWDNNVNNITSNLTVTAKYAPKSYTITFDTQGGSSTEVTKYADYNTSVSIPPDPTRSGYAFAGWFKDADYKIAWNFNDDKVTNNIILYAKWVEGTPSDNTPTPTNGKVDVNGILPTNNHKAVVNGISATNNGKVDVNGIPTKNILLVSGIGLAAIVLLLVFRRKLNK